MKKITSTPYLGRRSELTFSPDSKYLFHTEGNEVIALNVPWLTREFSIVTPWKHLSRLVWHPTKPLVAILGYEHKHPEMCSHIPIYNWQNRELEKQIFIIGSAHTGVFVGSDYLVYGGDGAYLYPLVEHKNIAILSEYQEFDDMSIHPDRRTLIFSKSDQQCVDVQIMDLENHVVPIGEDISIELDRELEKLQIQFGSSHITSALFTQTGIISLLRVVMCCFIAILRANFCWQ